VEKNGKGWNLRVDETPELAHPVPKPLASPRFFLGSYEVVRLLGRHGS
jgi:hypothetical protein